MWTRMPYCHVYVAEMVYAHHFCRQGYLSLKFPYDSPCPELSGRLLKELFADTS